MVESKKEKALFVPRQDDNAAIEQAQSDLIAWWSARGEHAEMHWAEWGGSDLPDMMRDRELTVRFLSSSNTSLRLAATALVAEYWPSNERFTADILRLQ